jgi:Protein of unknown function (DUF3099)
VIFVPGPLRWVFAVGAIVLPYIAVVRANAGGERRAGPVAPPTPRPRAGLPGTAPAPPAPRSSTVPGSPGDAPSASG